MNVLGIVAEYNPLHNGHMYHIAQAKALCNAKYVVCVMSGNFIQRGEPALINKWARTKIALNCEIDLVVELPFIYSMSSAEYFSYAAVKLLDSLGVVTHICFGSESGDINNLKIISDILHSQPEQYKKLLRQNLSDGLSFPAAREKSLKYYLRSQLSPSYDYFVLEKIVQTSNNILGIEYLKALKKLKSNIVPITIKRVGSSYNDSLIGKEFSSATSIRNLLSLEKTFTQNTIKILNKNLPYSSVETILDEYKNKRGPVFSSNFNFIAVWELRKCTPATLSDILYVSEGFENRLKHASRDSYSIKELIEKSSTKRFTRTRIQRMIFNLLIGLTHSEFDFFNKFDGPQYIRILGFNQNGKNLMSLINKNSHLPVFVNFSHLYKTCNLQIKKMLDYEILSTDLYVLAYENPDQRYSSQDFTNSIVIKK